MRLHPEARTDGRGRTPLAVAMLRGDRGAMERLRGADAMLRVFDIRAAIDWYCSIGFRLAGQHALDTVAAWAGLAAGGCYLMLVPGGTRPAAREASLWLRTERVEELHRALQQRQLDRASAVLAGSEPAVPEARFKQDLHDTFYGEREFTIIDPDGYELTFCRSIER